MRSVSVWLCAYVCVMRWEHMFKYKYLAMEEILSDETLTWHF